MKASKLVLGIMCRMGASGSIMVTALLRFRNLIIHILGFSFFDLSLIRKMLVITCFRNKYELFSP